MSQQNYFSGCLCMPTMSTDACALRACCEHLQPTCCIITRPTNSLVALPSSDQPGPISRAAHRAVRLQPAAPPQAPLRQLPRLLRCVRAAAAGLQSGQRCLHMQR